MKRTLLTALDSHDVVQNIVVEGKDASDLVNAPEIHYIAFTEGEFADIPLTVSFEPADKERIKITVTVEFSGEETHTYIPESVPATNALETAEELAQHLLR